MKNRPDLLNFSYNSHEVDFILVQITPKKSGLLTKNNINIITYILFLIKQKYITKNKLSKIIIIIILLNPFYKNITFESSIFYYCSL